MGPNSMRRTLEFGDWVYTDFHGDEWLLRTGEQTPSMPFIVILRRRRGAPEADRASGPRAKKTDRSKGK